MAALMSLRAFRKSLLHVLERLNRVLAQRLFDGRIDELDLVNRVFPRVHHLFGDEVVELLSRLSAGPNTHALSPQQVHVG